MKKIVFLAGLALLLAATSCSNESDNEVINHDAEVIDSLVPVHLHVNDFSSTQEDFPVTRTNAQSPTDYSGAKAMTLAFYNGTTEAYKTTQVKGDLAEGTTFGEFNLSLPIGSYTMVVLGYGYFDGDELSLTSPTEAAYTTDHVRETFSATQTVNITSSNPVEVSATLQRIVARLQLISSDNKIEDAKNIRMTFAAGGKSFNPTTGLATADTGFSNTVTISSSTGMTSNSASYLFLGSDEQTMDVTIETLDGEGNTIRSKVLSDVPFKRNRITKLTGLLYTTGISSSFLIDTDWLEEFTDTF